VQTLETIDIMKWHSFYQRPKSGSLRFLRARASIAVARISYGNSVRLSVRLSWCHVPIPFQAQVI